MALQIDVVRSPKRRREPGRNRAVLRFDKIVIGIPALLSVLLLAATTSLIAHLDSRKNILEKENGRIASEIRRIKREIENAKNRIEAASGKNIKRQITRLNLGLNLPKWGQRRPLGVNLYGSDTEIKEKKLAKKESLTFEGL